MGPTESLELLRETLDTFPYERQVQMFHNRRPNRIYTRIRGIVQKFGDFLTYIRVRNIWIAVSVFFSDPFIALVSVAHLYAYKYVDH